MCLLSHTHPLACGGDTPSRKLLRLVGLPAAATAESTAHGTFKQPRSPTAESTAHGTFKQPEVRSPKVRSPKVRKPGKPESSAALLPWPAASGSKPPTAAGYRRQQDPAAYLFSYSVVLRLSPNGGSGEGSPPPHGERRAAAKPPPQQDPAAFFFLCCCFCRCRLSAAAAGSHPTDDGKIHRLVQQNGRRWFSWSGSSSLTAESTAHGTFK